jgi:hypothetical protein
LNQFLLKATPKRKGASGGPCLTDWASSGGGGRGGGRGGSTTSKTAQTAKHQGKAMARDKHAGPTARRANGTHAPHHARTHARTGNAEQRNATQRKQPAITASDM